MSMALYTLNIFWNRYGWVSLVLKHMIFDLCHPKCPQSPFLEEFTSESHSTLLEL